MFGTSFDLYSLNINTIIFLGFTILQIYTPYFIKIVGAVTDNTILPPHWCQSKTWIIGVQKNIMIFSYVEKSKF